MFVARKLGRAYQPGQPKPKVRWRLDGKIIKALNEARKWVQGNPDIQGTMSVFGPNWPTLPEHVKIAPNGFMSFANTIPTGKTFVSPVEYRFVDCPACGGRVYMGSGARRDSS